jgi:hypothetical protein
VLFLFSPACPRLSVSVFCADGFPHAWFTQDTPVTLGKVDAVRGVRVINGSAGQDFITREYYYQIDQEAGLFWSDEEGSTERGTQGRGKARDAQITNRPSFLCPSACLDRYHDHSMGTTALNAYAGLAGLFFIRDHREHKLQVRQAQACKKEQSETAGTHADTPPACSALSLLCFCFPSRLQLSGVLPSGRYEWPLVLKDYWFMPNSGQLWYSLFGEHEVRERKTNSRQRSRSKHCLDNRDAQSRPLFHRVLSLCRCSPTILS